MGVGEGIWGQSMVDTASRLIERRREDSTGQGTDDPNRDVHGTHGFAHTGTLFEQAWSPSPWTLVDLAIANVHAVVHDRNVLLEHREAGLLGNGMVEKAGKVVGPFPGLSCAVRAERLECLLDALLGQEGGIGQLVI